MFDHFVDINKMVAIAYRDERERVSVLKYHVRSFYRAKRERVSLKYHVRPVNKIITINYEPERLGYKKMKMKMRFGLFITFLTLLACSKDDGGSNATPEIVSIDLQDAICVFDQKKELTYGTLCKLTKEGEVIPVNVTFSDNTTTTVAVSGLKHFTDKYLYIMTDHPQQVVLYEKLTGKVHNLTNLDRGGKVFDYFKSDREEQPVHTDRAGNFYFNLFELHRLDADFKKMESCVSNNHAKDVDVNLDGIVYRRLGFSEDRRRTFTLPSGTVLQIDANSIPQDGMIADVFLGFNNEHFYAYTKIKGGGDNARTYRLAFSEERITLIPCSHFKIYSSSSDDRAQVFKNDKRQIVCSDYGEFNETDCLVNGHSLAITHVAKDFFVYKSDKDSTYPNEFWRTRKTDYKKELLTVFDEKTAKSVTVSCSPTSNNIGFYGPTDGFYSTYTVGYINEDNQQIRAGVGHLSPSFFVMLN